MIFNKKRKYNFQSIPLKSFFLIFSIELHLINDNKIRMDFSNIFCKRLDREVFFLLTLRTLINIIEPFQFYSKYINKIKEMFALKHSDKLVPESILLLL